MSQSPAPGATSAAQAEEHGPDRIRRGPPKLRRWLMEGAILVAVVLGITAWQTRNLVATGVPAPAFELSTLNGGRVSLESLRGKRVLVHLWATWCGVCRMEISALAAVHDGLDADEALVTIVADSDDPAAVHAYVKEHGVRYPVLLGTDAVIRAFRVGAFPTSYYLDENGNIRSHTVGMSTRLSMNTRLALAR